MSDHREAKYSLPSLKRCVGMRSHLSPFCGLAGWRAGGRGTTKALLVVVVCRACFECTPLGSWMHMAANAVCRPRQLANNSRAPPFTGTPRAAIPE